MSAETFSDYTERMQLELSDPGAVEGYTRELIDQRRAIADALGVEPEKLHNPNQLPALPIGEWPRSPQNRLVDR